MDSESGSIKIEKLNDTNFHIWKVKIRMLLSIRELDQYLDDIQPPAVSDPIYKKWSTNDKKATAFIVLSLSTGHFEQVQHASLAKEMWNLVCDIYEKHALLNQLAARRKFYSAAMDESEKVLEFAARVRQVASTLKSMNVTVEDQGKAITFLSGLPNRFDSIITALDALSDVEGKFTFDFVVSRCNQEEQPHLLRDIQSLAKSETAALLASKSGQSGKCIYFGKQHSSTKC